MNKRIHLLINVSSYFLCSCRDFDPWIQGDFGIFVFCKHTQNLNETIFFCSKKNIPKSTFRTQLIMNYR